MPKSHVAVWGPDAPSPAQLKEFFAQIQSERMTGSRLQAALRGELPGLGVYFRNPVNYDNPRRHEIRTADYTYIDPDLTPEDFPISGKGKAEVTYGYLKYDHEPETQEVLDDVEADSTIRHPDRAETEDFLDAHPEEKDKYPVIGLCGSVVLLHGYRGVACVSADESVRDLLFDGLHSQWIRGCRFLVVCQPYQLFVRWNKETAAVPDEPMHLQAHEGYDTVQLMQDGKVIHSETFCNNRDRLYGYCLGTVEAMRRAGHSIEMPICLQELLPYTSRED